MDRDFTAIHVLRVSIIVSCVNLSGNVCRGTTVMNGLLLKLSSRRTNGRFWRKSSLLSTSHVSFC
jgi:hypothetical protein